MALGSILSGNSSVSDTSKHVNELLLENETVEKVYRTVRDEVVLTNLGLYIIDVQGITGSKVSYDFKPVSEVIGAIFESAGTGIDDAEVTVVFKYGVGHKIEFNKKNTEDAKDLFMRLKTISLKNEGLI